MIEATINRGDGDVQTYRHEAASTFTIDGEIVFVWQEGKPNPIAAYPVHSLIRIALDTRVAVAA